MEHTQKMVLVPQEQISRMAPVQHQQLQESSQTSGTQLTRLDAEMGDILRSGIDDSAKWERYNQVLQRYLHFVHREALDAGPPALRRQGDAEPRRDDPQKQRGNDLRVSETVLATVPERYKRKALKLLTKLQGMPNRIAWDRQGTVSIDNVKITDSNIVELLNEAMRERKKVTAKIVGRRRFAVLLRNAGVPRELVGNEKL